MDLPPDLLIDDPAVGAQRICLGFLDQARAAADRLGDPQDVEALHDFRVAIRRLRSAARAWRPELKGVLNKKAAKALRALQQATGGGRDAEVALEWLAPLREKLADEERRGFDWLVRRLEQRLAAFHAKASTRVLDAFEKLEKPLRKRLARVQLEVRIDRPGPRPAFGNVLIVRVREHAAELAKRLGRVLSPADETEMHTARIRTKRLRYLLEPVTDHVPGTRDLVKQLKALQTVLGDLNDAHVLRLQLGKALEQAAEEHARRVQQLGAEEDPEGLADQVQEGERVGLRALVERVRGRSRALYTSLAADYLADGAHDLLGGVEAWTRRTAGLVRGPVEIERKYLLDGMPELPAGAEAVVIEQGYLDVEGWEERLRRVTDERGTRCYRTFKLGGGIRRVEFEARCPESLFDALWPQTEGRRVRKRRHSVRVGQHVFEVDEFLDRELVLAEVELKSEHESVVLPDWLADHVKQDVSEIDTYRNSRLAG